MKAKKETWCNGTRIKLKDVLPIETPITIGIEPASLCNLKCDYCVHGAEVKNFPQQFMNFDIFTKTIDSLQEFPQKIKNIVFALNGEPLINPQLPDMVRYIKQKNVADTVTIFTNAVLLNEEMGRKLLDAGLDILRVSIQGVSGKRYEELSGVRIDYQGLLDNISNFYNYKEQNNIKCHIFVKIVDQSFNTLEDEEKFYHDFGDICDQISVETIVPIRIEVDYSRQEVSSETNLVKQSHKRADVCPQPFYGMYVRSNGAVIACCIADINKQVIGNVEKQGLYEIWNSKELADIRMQQLLRKRYENSECRKCSFPNFGIQINDDIDEAAGIIYEKMFGGKSCSTK